MIAFIVCLCVAGVLLSTSAYAFSTNSKFICRVVIQGYDENNKLLYSKNKAFIGTEGEFEFSAKEVDGYEIAGESSKKVNFDRRNRNKIIRFEYRKKEAKQVTLDFTKEKIGIALPSGGFLGSYTVGQLMYLRDAGIEIENFDSIVGTSVGAVNEVALLSVGLDGTIDIWNNIKSEDIYKGDLSTTKCEAFNKILDKLYTAGNNVGNLALILRGFIGGSVDNSPLRELLESKVDKDKVLNSGIEVGLVTTKLDGFKQVIATNRNGKLTSDNLIDYTMMSSSCYPVFPIAEYEGEKYIDGGYTDPNNGKFLFSEFNCDKAIVLDLQNYGNNFSDDNRVIYCSPSEDVGSFLDTNQETIQRNMKLGYEDMKKAMENVKIVK